MATKDVLANPEHILTETKNKFGDAIEETKVVGNQAVVYVKSPSIVKVARWAKEELNFKQPIWLTAIDNKDNLELVYFFNHFGSPMIYTIRSFLDRDNPVVDSLTPFWPAANWLEREMYDMFGIRFEGHPNLRRLYLPDDWEGHPLRKDYVPKEYPWKERVESYYDSNEYYKEHFKLADNEMLIHMGPQHPILHGTWKLMVRVRGDTIIEGWPEIGYIHRGTEKLAEGLRYEQIIPLTDRLCYVSSMSWHTLYTMTVEKLFGVEASIRAQYIRTIVLELQRIISHVIWLIALAADIGTYHSLFLYGLREREKFLDLFEQICGARLTYTYSRIGGVAKDIPDGWTEKVKETLIDLEHHMPEYRDLMEGSELFHMRTRNVGTLSTETAIEIGARGPMLRASNVSYDVRKIDPYLMYSDVDFNIVTAKDGDVYSRYLVRMGEVEESIKIIQQLIDKVPSGEYRKKITPKKPVGEGFMRTEDPRGESAMFIVGRGTFNPYRLMIATPAYMNLSTIPYMLRNVPFADVAAIVASVDLCMGEVDK